MWSGPHISSLKFTFSAELSVKGCFLANNSLGLPSWSKNDQFIVVQRYLCLTLTSAPAPQNVVQELIGYAPW